MKALMKVMAVVLVAVLMVSTTITAYAGQLPEKQKEVEVSAEEESVLNGDINEAEDQSENEIADDIDSEELPEDEEEIEIPAEDVSDEDIIEADIIMPWTTLQNKINAARDGDLFIDSSMKVWFEGKDPVSQSKRSEICHSFSNQWLHIGVR